MKYALKQKWMNLRDSFSIIDEKGLEAFRVNGSAMTGKKISFRDRKDNELAFIHQKSNPATGPAFEIYHGDDLQAIVRKDGFSQQKCKFTADASAPDDLHAEGDFSQREYSFIREGKKVGRVSKSLFGNSGVYGVEVGRGEDELVLLASAFVIDLCCQTGQPV